jgi:V/A-type H+-transporting ATPase subunit I
MIVPMKKYAFMVFHKEYDAFLITLRDLGVVHVQETKSINNNADLQDLQAIRKRIKSSLDYFDKLNSKTKNVELSPSRNLNKAEGLKLLDKIESLQEKKSQLQQEKQALEKDISYMDIWGNFSYTIINNLKENGYIVTFFTCPTARFEPKWKEEYNAFLVNNVQSLSYFVTITKEGQPIEIEAERAKMPNRGLDILISSEKQLDENIENVDNELKIRAAANYTTLVDFDKSLQDEFNFANVIEQTDREADDRLMFLEGWTTADQANNLEKELDEKGYYCQELEIQEGDKVPIKLKNNAYSRLFEPITRMFSLPNYTEIDPTPLLAPFFMLFFGLCFGDGGYGLLVILVCAFLKKKVSHDLKPVLSLAQYLGAAAVVVGTFTGTFFGVTLVDVPAFHTFKDYFLTSDNLMTLALVLGLVHIVFGKCVAAYKTKKQKGVKYSIAPWAWVFVITSLLIVLGLPFMDIHLSQTVTYICYGIAIASALVAFLYNSPGKNIFINIGSGLWTTYNSASGLLGDTLSYIRLFAIGLTGGILGGVFNKLGVDMTAGLPMVARIPVMLLVLMIGHGLNIGLCTISSLVHPVRLVFVEYFKNSEFEGGGKEYLPFKKA